MKSIIKSTEFNNKITALSVTVTNISLELVSDVAPSIRD